MVGDRATAALYRAWPVVLVYMAVRGLGLLVLSLWAAVVGSNPHQLLAGRWDSLWYMRIARFGYGWQVELADGAVHSNLAFFPLLPWLERVLVTVSPLSYGDAGLTVSWVASVLAAWGIYLIAERLYGPRAGCYAVMLWAAMPVGIVQSMAYSESLFTALAAWALYAVLRRQWVAAGLLAVLAGLTRPFGMAVVAAVVVAALVTCVRERKLSWQPVVGALLAPWGTAGYVLWVGWYTGGGIFGYLDVQGQWNNGFDAGLNFVQLIGSTFTAFPAVLGGVGMVLGLGAVAWLCLSCVRQRQPMALLAYWVVTVALAFGTSGYFGSKPRFLVPAFVLFFPLAVQLARARAGVAVAVAATAVLVSAVFGA
ncbi:MAG: hypothetical protein GEV07_17835 [Streptosporangiales bacterium]|nr:hypothetical protein [Streptosporangiales bacterium]